MAIYLLLAFILTPLAEIALFVRIGGEIGLWPTLATVLVTALVGTAVLRHQGLVTLTRARASLARGEMPLAEAFDGACLMASGLLLLTPGFLTDAVGALLLVPAVRLALMGLLARRLAAFVTPQGGAVGDRVVDADFTVIDPDREKDP